MKNFLKLNLVLQIIIGMIVGSILGVFSLGLPSSMMSFKYILDLIPVFGMVFTGFLKAVAPVLVFVLIINTIASHKGGNIKKMFSIIKLYMIGTLLAALTAVVISFAHPVTLSFNTTNLTDIASAPSSLSDVFTTIINNIVDNPINALATGNYLGILMWAILLGLMLKSSSETTKSFLTDISNAVAKIVELIISFAPLGIMGLIYASVTSVGIKAIISYGSLLFNLLFAMAIIVFVINPIIVYIYTRENPYPLIFTCLKESGLTAFFTRSSAANIPVNIALAKKLNIDSDLYNLSIPLGSTINMGGAAITITTLTLATVFSQGIHVTFAMALVLSVVATLSACGTSGVGGGSLLLIPLACSLFGIDADIVQQIVGIGFIISVIQDSCETALNSSSDILYTAIVDKKMKLAKK